MTSPMWTQEAVQNYTCCVCGQVNQFDFSHMDREEIHCSSCRCNARWRGTIMGLMDFLIGHHQIPLKEQPPQSHLRVLGISDDEAYASIVREKFTYMNTFVHQEPKLDLCDKKQIKNYTGYDAVICSDVLEHTRHGPRQVLENMRGLLRPGGAIILSVPTYKHSEHLEWYSGHKSLLVTKDRDDRYHVVWENLKGNKYIDDTPVFHGGHTLEMRQISQLRLLEDAMKAGFTSRMISFEPGFGYVWWPLYEPPYEMGDAGFKVREAGSRVICLEMLR